MARISTKPTITSVLNAVIPSSSRIKDYDTRRVVDALVTALRTLSAALDGSGRFAGLSIPPDTRITGGPGIKVSQWSRNAFAVEIIPPPVADVEDDDDTTEIENHPWKFTRTSDTAGNLTAGLCFVDGAKKTITDLPSSISVTTTTRYYIEVNYDTDTATWKTTTGAFPDGSATKEVFPILTITHDGTRISDVVQNLSDDVVARSGGGSSLPNGTNNGDLLYWKADTSEWAVAAITSLSNNAIIALKWDDTNKIYVKQATTTQDVVTNVTYSSSTHKLEQVKKTLTVLGSADEATTTVTTAVEES